MVCSPCAHLILKTTLWALRFRRTAELWAAAAERLCADDWYAAGIAVTLSVLATATVRSSMDAGSLRMLR